MKYYSTNKIVSDVALKDAVIKSLAADKGLFMPNSIKRLPQEFFDNIDKMSFQEISYRVADAYFGEDIPTEELKRIVYDTIAFDAPVVEVKKMFIHWSCSTAPPLHSKTWAAVLWHAC